MQLSPPPDFLCTDVSLALNEPMAGTAVHVGVWLLLEVRAPWRAKATSDNDLPQSVQAWLEAQMAAVDNGRLQFIKQHNTPDDAPLTFFVVVNDEAVPKLYRFTLAKYEDLLDLDVTTIVANAAASALSDELLVLVCTNGKRDRCCAKLGLPLYDALFAALGSAVWKTTHTGGHRFAPTLLTFPQGVSYGRLQPDEVETFSAHLQQQTLWLQKLRGRTCYDSIVQGADFYLRQETGEMALRAFQYEAIEMENGRWHVTFTHASTGQRHRITLAAAEPLQLYASSATFKLKIVPQYAFIAHSTF